MDNLDFLKANIEYFDKYFGSEPTPFDSAPFLKNKFEAETWDLDFGLSEPMRIDFRILVETVPLTSCLDGDLCRLFKRWICAAGTNYNPMSTLSNSTMQRKVANTVGVIDWLLINNDSFRIHEHGLKLLNSNNLKALLASCGRSPNLSTVVYEWPEKLRGFLKGLVESTPKIEIYQALEDYPILTEPWEELSQSILEIEDALRDDFPQREDICTVRAALWLAGFYICGPRSALTIDTTKIARILYVNTLGGVKHYPIPTFFVLKPRNYQVPEFSRVPVRARHASMTPPATGAILSTFEVLRVLRQNSNLTPVSDLEIPSSEYLEEQFNLSKVGRFTSLPVALTLKCLRDSIEFYLEYGKAIISSYLRLMESVIIMGIPYQSTRCESIDISRYLDGKLSALNVNVWNKQFSSRTRKNDPNFKAKFDSLRSTPSLHELMQVLLGAIQVTLGVLQARRASELRKIIAGQCLSSDHRSLETVNRKTGLYGLNVKIVRPIPHIAADMIQSLETMQASLIKLGLLDRHREVLSGPLKNGRLENLHPHTSQLKFDIFCDYFQTPLDDRGRRFYLRHHQLRRFFAQVFFWHQTEKEDTLDILRWVLGHGDSEMIYHYITESTPGQVLREVKAEWGARMLRAEPDKVSNLTTFIQKHYQISDFAILPEEQIEEHLLYCISTGSVKIEPEFLTGSDGTPYRIIATIRDKGNNT